MDTSPDTASIGVRARLKMLKEAAGETRTVTLPISGLVVTFPAFITHDKVMAASKIAGKDRARTGFVLVAQLCLFEGERLTVDEILSDLLHRRDAVHLVNLLLGDGEDEGGSGN